MSAVTKEDYFDRKWNLDHPELGTGSVSTEPYLSEEYFEVERDAVFRRSWLNLGRVEEIPEVGDYLTKDIAVCNASVIVVRGHDGTIKAFHNACRHRSNKLAWQEKGSCQSFNCKFHGWNYDLDGRLKFVPDEDRFYDLDKNSSGLLPVHVDTWNGFIFINLNESPAETLREYLAALGERLDDFPFDDMVTTYCYRTVLDANWKTAVHAYNELYHLGFVHKETGGTSMVGKENMFGRPIWVGLGARHQTISVYGNPNHQLTPVEALAAKFGPMFSQGVVGGGSGLNPDTADMWTADVNVFFPNFFVDTFMGSYFSYNFWPLSHKQTLYEYRHYTLKPENAAHRFTNEFSRIWLRELLLEDMEMIEQSQRGLNSRAVTQIQLGDSEIGVRHHLKVVDDSVATLKVAKEKEA